jgi:predicted metal-binding protein
LADALHIQQMVARARALGAGSAAPLPARAVVVDERVNFKCRVPLCASYGVNLMCPPNTPTAAETRTVLARYSDTLVVQLDIPLTQAAVDEVLEGMGYAEAQAPGAAAASTGAADPGGNGGGAGGNAQTAAYEARLRDSQNEFARVMTALEAEAFKMGYRFAAAFAGGDCVLCDVCAGANGQPCNHPFEARPSMEAVGIDVVATAEAAGLAIELPADEHPRWTGLLLID